VIGVIYGVAWVLRQVKASRQPRATGAGLAALASVPLGPNRSVHLVRAGRDLVLLGVAEQGVVPIRTYSEEEARDAGLIDEDGMLLPPTEDDEPRRPSRVALKLPKLPQLALPAPTTKPARPRSARPALPAPRNALDMLRAWTVRS
jgi:flagellar protein FliO/FliZ